MATTIKIRKPTSSGRRHQSQSGFTEITKKKSQKSLLRSLKKKVGRNNGGRICVRHRGGGSKRRYRIIDSKRNKDNIPAQVAAIEYDPNRSARIALLHYIDGEKRYIIAPSELKVGDEVISGENSPVKAGNSLPLKKIPEGSFIYNIELKEGKGGQLVRSAGVSAQLLSKEGKYAQVRLPSSEIRLVRLECKATVGQIGNAEYRNIQLGKAGRSRWLGRRPKVRGVAMNPVDHPHGGGEDRGHLGGPPVTPWGGPIKGKKTRKKKKSSDFLIIRRRRKKVS